MPVVVDASLLVRLAARGRWVERIDAKLDEWASAGEELHAPDLLPYELESALRSLVFARELSEAQAIEGLERIGIVPLTLHPHPGGARLLRMAGRQATRLAYDSAYLVLAEGLAADLWTADRRLANNGRSLGIQTRFIGDSEDDPSRE